MNTRHWFHWKTSNMAQRKRSAAALECHCDKVNPSACPKHGIPPGKPKRSAAATKPKRYIMVHGKSYPVNTELGVKLARLALLDAGYPSARIWQDGVSTPDLLHADLGRFSDNQR